MAAAWCRLVQVVDTKTGEFVVDKVRTSSGYFLRRQQDDIIKRLEERIAEWTRLPITNGEPFHILRYQVTMKGPHQGLHTQAAAPGEQQ